MNDTMFFDYPIIQYAIIRYFSVCFIMTLQCVFAWPEHFTIFIFFFSIYDNLNRAIRITTTI